MSASLEALRTSSQRLDGIVGPLDDAAITRSAYPQDWSIAQVMSHLGSGAVILQRRLDDALAGTVMPDDFAPTVWDEWNAKPPRAQRDDGLAADAALLARFDAVSETDRRTFSFSMGPITADFEGFVGLRLNEHAFHTWDIEVAIDTTATLPRAVTDLVIDNLELVARYTAKASGAPTTVTIGTTAPDRTFTLVITPEGTTLVPAKGTADVELPAEAFARLIYGRLDADHTPPFSGDRAVVDLLRNTFPGP